MHPELVTLVVKDDDEAIAFFVDKLQFELIEDSPASDRWPSQQVGRRPTAGSEHGAARGAGRR
jgi:catechol 2,3-dioxygenase-like lactoylglutathione lyase family enzyme